jgi:hypothetical protein
MTFFLIAVVPQFESILTQSSQTDGAIAFAQEIVAVRPLPLVRNLKCVHPNPDGYFQFTRNTVGAMSKNFPAPLGCIDAVEASVKERDFDAGIATERRLFVGKMGGEVQCASKALAPTAGYTALKLY